MSAIAVSVVGGAAFLLFLGLDKLTARWDRGRDDDGTVSSAEALT